MSLLALDLSSTVVGWALFRAGRLAMVGEWDLVGSRQPGDGPGGRWVRLLGRLNRLVDLHGVEVGRVAYEQITFAGPGQWRAAQRWGAAEGILELWLEVRGIRPSRTERVHVAEVKRAATGKGGGEGTDKEAMLAAARVRWPGVKFPGCDAADAAFIGLAVIRAAGN